MAGSVASLLVSSRPDYVNSILYGTSLKNINSLQRIQHSLASVVTKLVKPRHNLSFGSHTFRISAPHIWNSLPTNIREAQSLLTLRRHLKTHYFQSAFSTP